MYDIIEEINNIMCLPESCWSEVQREIVEGYFGPHNSPYSFPGDEDSECTHPEFETRYLFTSCYRACKVCGVEEVDV